MRAQIKNYTLRQTFAVIRDKMESVQFLQGVAWKKIAPWVFMLVLAVLFLYGALIETQLKRLRAIDFKFNAQKKLADFYGNLSKDEGRLFRATKEKEGDFSKLKGSFILEEELPDHFVNFRSLVKLHNLEVASLDFKPNDSSKARFGYFQELSFNASIKGSYFNIMSLLQKLEENKPALEIGSVHIYKDSEHDYSVGMDIQATIYVLKKGI